VWQNVMGLGVVALTGELSMGGDEAPNADNEDETEGPDAKKLKSDPDAAVPNPSFSSTDTAPVLPILDLIPTALSQTPSAPLAASNPLQIGDLRIADLRSLLRSLGHIAEFRGEGTLLVDGSVVVRKGAEGRIEIESGAGGLGRVRGGGRGSGEGTFWAVRRAVGRGLAVVGGVL
jgi:cleavage and polyadenylation specificity factor subunit 2